MNLYILSPLFVWIGLMGGASYVNINHGYLERETLPVDEKEIAVSVSLIFVDIGNLSASIFTLVAAKTIFPSH